MARRDKTTPPDPGTFVPGAPNDSQEVLELYAIAARAACAKPDVIEDITKRLSMATAQLVAPASLAARECSQLWEVFIRVAQRPKVSLRAEAARALVRDLDNIGRKLDLPPLSAWEEMPEGIAADNPVEISPEESYHSGESLTAIRKRAAEQKRKRGKGPPLKAKEVLDLLKSASPKARDEMFKEAVGSGALGRTDATLLAQSLAMDTKVAAGQDLLRDYLEKLGTWLVQQ